MNRSLSLAVAFAAMTTSTFATDRVVSPTGTYNTIGSAIAASSDGDRVLVTSGTYAENIALSQSVSLLANQEGGRFTVTGSVALQNANGKSITIAGGRILGSIYSTGSYTARTEVRIVDSYTGSCDLDEPTIRLELYRDTVNGEVRISSGTITGCVLYGTAFSSTIVKIQSASSLPEDIWVVGNMIGSSTSLKKGMLINTNRTFHIENNVFIDNGSGSSSVDLAFTSDQFAAPSTILNNSFMKMTAESFPAVANSTGFVLNLVLKNNAVLRFNAIINNVVPWTQLVQSNNLLTAPTWINQTTGQPTVGSPLLNAGDPDPRYLDLDLTTNDVGCYGGSNSRANFATGMGSAVVGFMQAPRVVAQGEAVNIQATGFDR